MKISNKVVIMALAVPAFLGIIGQDNGFKKPQAVTEACLSFKADVFPIVQKYCLPCHAEESYNPSQLSLDTYELLMKGGKHGSPVVPGKPEESIMLKKLSPDPPFGDTMPLKVRRRKNPSQEKKLTEEEIRTITEWIKQGARDN